MGQITVDPNMVNERYKTKLAEAVHEALVMGAAADQLHDRNTQLEGEVEELKRQNQALLAQTGRTDPELEGDEVE